MLHKNQNIDPDNAKPCFHMPRVLSQLADGTAQGFVRWYGERHTAGCPHCAASLIGLQRLRERLRIYGILHVEEEATLSGEARGLTEERFARVEVAWEAMEAERGIPRP